MEAPEETEPIMILDPEQEELGKIDATGWMNVDFNFLSLIVDLNHGKVGKIENLEPLTKLERYVYIIKSVSVNIS
jgi:hypothetical protein